LHIESDLLKLFKDSGYFVALETNGTGALPYGVDYVALSPKRNSPPIVLTAADEVRFTLARGQRPFALPFIPKYVCLSPAFRGLELDAAAVEWCIALVKEHPTWTLSVQLHKLLRIP
jgi:organic radical activating enzyme